MKGGADNFHEEAKKRERLTRFATHPRYLLDQKSIVCRSVDLYKASKNNPESCRGKEGWLGSLIKCKALKKSSSSLRISGNRSSARYVLLGTLGSG